MPLESQVVLRGLTAGGGTGTAAGAGIRVGDCATTQFPAIEDLVAVVVGVVVRGGVQWQWLHLVRDQRTNGQSNLGQLGEIVQLLGNGCRLLVLRHRVEELVKCLQNIEYFL